MPECPENALFITENKVFWNQNACIQCDNCIKVCPSNSSPKTVQLTVDELFEKIGGTLVFTSGLTISGGECTAQYDFLLEFLKEAKARNISVFVDTNGNLNPGKMAVLAKYFDKAMLDIKSADPNEHFRSTESEFDFVIENADYLLKNNKLHEIRTVIVPELLDNEKNVAEIGRLIAKNNPDLLYKLIKYRRLGVKNGEALKEPEDDYLEKLKIIAQKAGCKNVIVV